MRAETDRSKLERFMVAFGRRVRGPGRIYLTGGTTAVLKGWRTMTIDVDLKADPEPPGCFEAIEPELIRFPAVNVDSLRLAVERVAKLRPTMIPRPDLLRGLPGEEFIVEGLADLEHGRTTVAACLVAISRPRLERAGLLGGLPASVPVESERVLYRLLREEGGDAYPRYNALLRRLVSFERALDHRLSRAQDAAEAGSNG